MTTKPRVWYLRVPKVGLPLAFLIKEDAERFTHGRPDDEIVRVDDGTFGHGVVSMARNTLSACQLVREGEWSIEDIEGWLQAVIDNDDKYLEKAREMIANK